MTLAEIAGCAYIDATAMPEGMELGLEQTLIYDPTNFVFPFGTHICVVDVDANTGKIEIVRWVAVDDCGPAVNPMLIDGQVHGGVAHGIGQALYEQVVYDDRGQLVTGTFMDYALPTAAEIPSFELDRTETKSPSNSLGVKGIGEAGTIAVDAGDRQRGHRRAAPRGHHVPRHAAHAAARLGGARGGARPRRRAAGHRAGRGPPAAGRGLRRLRTDQPRRRCGMIPAAFDYAVAESVDDAIRLLGEGGEDAKLLAGGHSLLPLMKLRFTAPSLLVDIGAARGPARRRDRRRLVPDRRADAPRRPAVARRHGPHRGGGEADRRPAGAKPRHDRRLARQRRRGGGPAGGAARLRRLGHRARPRRRARDRGGGPLRGLPHDVDRARRGAHAGAHPGAGRLRLRLREVQPPRRGLGDGRRLRARQEGRRRRRARTSAWA